MPGRLCPDIYLLKGSDWTVCFIFTYAEERPTLPQRTTPLNPEESATLLRFRRDRQEMDLMDDVDGASCGELGYSGVDSDTFIIITRAIYEHDTLN
jgi:hypothetical protein